jgi:hypothetical protein
MIWFLPGNPTSVTPPLPPKPKVRPLSCATSVPLPRRFVSPFPPLRARPLSCATSVPFPRRGVLRLCVYFTSSPSLSFHLCARLPAYISGVSPSAPTGCPRGLAVQLARPPAAAHSDSPQKSGLWGVARVVLLQLAVLAVSLPLPSFSFSLLSCSSLPLFL